MRDTWYFDFNTCLNQKQTLHVETTLLYTLAWTTAPEHVSLSLGVCKELGRNENDKDVAENIGSVDT